MSRIALRSNPLGTGTFTIESPNSNTDSTIVLPDGGGAIVLTDATQTLTNKSISASQVNSGTLDVARIPDLAASKITTGTVATARLGSGTANNTTFLRGDQTWQTISTTPTTDQVLTATAGASVGAVGTYALMATNNTSVYGPGATLAGSSLLYVGFGTNTNWTFDAPNRTIMGTGVYGGTATGTWRCMGHHRGTTSGYGFNAVFGASLWLRIS